jgi:hypothetical protein
VAVAIGNVYFLAITTSLSEAKVNALAKQAVGFLTSLTNYDRNHAAISPVRTGNLDRFDLAATSLVLQPVIVSCAGPRGTDPDP